MDKKIEKFFLNGNKEKIIGQKENLSSAVIVLFCNYQGEIQILFEKRAAKIVQGGEISFPGGRKDKEDKTYMETALRETYEEIGLIREKISKLKNYGKIFRMTGEVIEVKTGYVENFSFEDLNLNKEEVDRVFLVPLKYFLDTLPKIEKIMVENNPDYVRNGKILKFPARELNLPEKYWTPWGREREVFFYEYDNETIWGITGEIILSLVEEIKKEDKNIK